MSRNIANVTAFPRPVVVASQLTIFVLVCGILFWAQFVLVPISLGILCSFVLHPGVRFLERRKVPRSAAIGVILAIALGAMTALGWIFVAQLTNLLGDIPQYRENIMEKIGGVRGVTQGETLSELQDTIRDVEKELGREEVVPGEPQKPLEQKDTAVPVTVVPATEMIGITLDDLTPYFNFIFRGGLVVLLTVFFLYWREDLVERLVGLAGQARMVVTTNALSDAGSRISRYLGLQFIVNVAYGLIASFGLYLLDVPYALVWGGFAGVVRYIPYVGSVLGTLTAAFAALILLPGWEPVLYVLILYVSLDLTVNVVEPFIFGSGLGVSVLAIIFSVIILAWLWGPVGAILATPFAGCLVVLGEYVPGLSFLAWLMSKKPRLEPQSNFYHRILRHDFAGAKEVLEGTFRESESEVLAVERIVVPTINQILIDQRAGAFTTTDTDWIGNTIADILEGMDREPDLELKPADLGNSFFVCPPASPLDDATIEALIWSREHIPAPLWFNNRGRLIAEVISELTEQRPKALILFARASDEKRQTKRWRHHLDAAGLDLPLVLFSWAEPENPMYSESSLIDAGADHVLRGLDSLIHWLKNEQKRTTPTTA